MAGFIELTIKITLKKLVALHIILCSISFNAIADHIKGGEIFYTCTGVSGNNYTYHITVKLLMVCNTTREFNNPTFVSFFKRGTNERIADVSVALERTEVLELQDNNPCIINPPDVCSRIGYYEFNVVLPGYQEGYIITTQVIFRVDGMLNLLPGYDRIGATYIGTIPGTNTGAGSPKNNSALFTGKDQVIICAGNYFSYSFAASDGDGDRLRYSLCGAYQGGESGFGNTARPPDAPPYPIVLYGNNYSGSNPLGRGISIDENTGIISGIAPATGIYVLSVCVDEIRNNIIIATQHKDIQINIANCSLVSAQIPDPLMLCGDTKTINIYNSSPSSLITAYNWQFLNSNGATIFTSSGSTATYTFPDTGVYKIKLAINANGSCSDSSSSQVFVYPGFVPGFAYQGFCVNKATSFFDTTTSVYGTVNKWDWDFGDGNSIFDFSESQNPTYVYISEGPKKVRMTVANSKGCIDTVYHDLSVFQKPPVQLTFRDTLICLPDNVQLQANGGGIFNWSPAVNITGANTSTPVVSPTVSTTYYVDMDQDGCVNRDSVTVNVADHVSLQAMNDTTICQGDRIQLRIVSNGLKYTWSPALQMDDSNAQNPNTVTTNNTVYSVTAAIGSCSANEEIKVAVVPYPFVYAGADTVICFETTAQLNGLTDGSSFIWSPQVSLQFSNTLNPLAVAGSTTSYTLTGYDIKGCPKPGIDTVLVTVLPAVKAFAGNDTSVVINQPLQFNASGGKTYSWSPSTGLSATDISNPTGIYNTPDEGIRYLLKAGNAAGCTDTDFITIKVYKVLPSVFVPTAFTPNKDGRNDILKPSAVM